MYFIYKYLLTVQLLTGLLAERAVLLGKLKQHNQALAIYVMVLDDYEKALQYCDQVYQKGGLNAHQVDIFIKK